MLKAAPFRGPDDAARATIARFWADVNKAVGPRETNIDRGFEDIKHRRRIRFFDTKDNWLHESSYIFRERVDVDTGDREVTLKYRHPDPFVVIDRDMSTSGRGAETKVEEDVKPPFVSVFSFSTTAPVSRDEPFAPKWANPKAMTKTGLVYRSRKPTGAPAKASKKR